MATPSTRTAIAGKRYRRGGSESAKRRCSCDVEVLTAIILDGPPSGQSGGADVRREQNFVWILACSEYSGRRRHSRAGARVATARQEVSGSPRGVMSYKVLYLVY
jgi:hypothetical protein